MIDPPGGSPEPCRSILHSRLRSTLPVLFAGRQTPMQGWEYLNLGHLLP